VIVVKVLLDYRDLRVNMASLVRLVLRGHRVRMDNLVWLVLLVVMVATVGMDSLGLLDQ
jgi:phosphate starvation-inducible membrane PsiE